MVRWWDNAAVSHTFIREKSPSWNHADWQKTTKTSTHKLLHTHRVMNLSQLNMRTGNAHRRSQNMWHCSDFWLLLNMPEGSVHAPYRHILRIQIVEGVHMAVDMKQVTLHYTHMCSHVHACTHEHSLSTLYRCAVVKSSYPGAPPVVSACSPISALTCSSPSDTHSDTHTHTSCSVCCSGCCCYGNPSIVQGDPCFPRLRKPPSHAMWVGTWLRICAICAVHKPTDAKMWCSICYVYL